MAVNIVPLAPYYWPAFYFPEKKSCSLKVLQTNVLASNKNYTALFKLIQKEKPDLIAAEEVSFAWALALEKGLPNYPYRIVSPESTAFGIALLSKVPLKNAAIIYLGQGFGSTNRHFPTIVAEIWVQRNQ